MRPSEFQKYLERDLHCPHCGKSDETLIPGHRRSRGMGGSKARNNHANILVMCSEINGLLESDPVWMETGKRFGWRLNSWEDADIAPIYDVSTGQWSYLDNNLGRYPLISLDDVLE
jgi:hypothetical protein